MRFLEAIGAEMDPDTYLEHEYLPRGPVYVEFAVVWIVRIDALACQEIHDVLGPIFVAVGCGHLNTTTLIRTGAGAARCTCSCYVELTHRFGGGGG